MILREQKNKKAAMLPLSPSIQTILSFYISRYGLDVNDYLFPNRYGDHLTYNALRMSFERYNTKRGVSKHNFHGLRHSFARLAVKNGMSAFELKEWMQHSSIEVTQKYVHLFSEDLSVTLDKNPLEILTTSRKSKFK